MILKSDLRHRMVHDDQHVSTAPGRHKVVISLPPIHWCYDVALVEDSSKACRQEHGVTALLLEGEAMVKALGMDTEEDGRRRKDIEAC